MVELDKLKAQELGYQAKGRIHQVFNPITKEAVFPQTVSDAVMMEGRTVTSHIKDLREQLKEVSAPQRWR